MRTISKEIQNFIQCLKCGVKIPANTNKRMTPCGCGAISVDGCEHYVRVLGSESDYVDIGNNSKE